MPQPLVAASVAPLANDLALEALLQQFQRRLEYPLLSLLDPTVVHHCQFSVAQPTVRCSKRIAAKGKGLASSAVKWVQRLLMHKLGIYRENERLSDSQLREYKEIFATPLEPEHVQAIATLFGISCAPEQAPAAVDADAAEA
jgi:hypothetical protein